MKIVDGINGTIQGDGDEQELLNWFGHKRQFIRKILIKIPSLFIDAVPLILMYLNDEEYFHLLFEIHFHHVSLIRGLSFHSYKQCSLPFVPMHFLFQYKNNETQSISTTPAASTVLSGPFISIIKFRAQNLEVPSIRFSIHLNMSYH